MIQDNDNGPELWLKIISDLREYFPDNKIVIAGGAVRDYRLGVKPKDIDVFINVGDDELEFEFGIHDLGQKFALTDVEASAEKIARYSEGNTEMKNIVGVYEISPAEGQTPVQIIGCQFKDGHDLIDKFDANICLCFFDDKGELFFHNAAQKDMNDRTYTLRLGETDEARYKTESRYYRFQDRVMPFVGPFKFIDPIREAKNAEFKKYMEGLRTDKIGSLSFNPTWSDGIIKTVKEAVRL